MGNPLSHEELPISLGPYTLTRLLARGGMAEVYEAWRSGPRGFAKRFALKRLLPQFARDERYLRMFDDEARVQALLTHPNLVQVVDFGEHGGEPFIALEFVDGVSLADALEAAGSAGRVAGTATVARIARTLLEGLGHVHDACDPDGRPLRLVHRDVSPENILISKLGEIKLADFGILRGAGFGTPTRPGELKGKLGYVAPEQCQGQLVDHRSDLFSLAVVLAELVLGRPLFGGRSPLEIVERVTNADLTELERAPSGLNPSLKNWLKHSLARRREDRFPDASAMLRALEQALSPAEFHADSTELLGWLVDLRVINLRSRITPRAPTQLDVPQLDASQRNQSRLAADRASASPVVARVSADASLPLMIRRPGGTIVGPVALSSVVEMLVTGGIDGETQVSKAGGGYGPLSSLPPFERYMQRRLMDFGPLPAQLAQRAEPIAFGSVAARLFGLVSSRATGLLILRRDTFKLQIALESGVPLAVACSDPTQLFCHRLQRAGMLSSSDHKKCVEGAFTSGIAVGTWLVTHHVIRKEVLPPLLEEQLVERLSLATRQTEGQLVFWDGRRDEVNSLLPTGRGPYALVATAVRRSFRPEELNAWRPRLAGLRARVANPTGELEAALLPTELERRLLAGIALSGRLDGGLDDLGTSPRGSERALAALVALLAAGVVVPES